MAAAANLLMPLYALMLCAVLQSRVVQTDETRVPVQDPNQDKTKSGRLWVYLADCDHPFKVYDYTPTKARDGPAMILAGYQGFLQSDAAIPSQQRVAFEFRHSSWFDEEIFGLLRDHRAVLCMADIDDSLEQLFVATTDWGYLRLRRADYDDTALKTWVKRIQEPSWREAFVFFMHDDQANGPRFARKLLDLTG
jgi:hypothetical protein